MIAHYKYLLEEGKEFTHAVAQRLFQKPDTKRITIMQDFSQPLADDLNIFCYFVQQI